MVLRLFWMIGFVLGGTAGMAQHAVAVKVNLQFAGKPLALNSQVYRSEKGDSLLLDVVRFYLSNVALIGRNQHYSEPESYHLVDAELPEKQSFTLENVQEGRYDSLSFLVGTDSLVNVSGAMGGDLDPSLGMYWAWNSGFINVKMEGRSATCPTRNHAFEFHLGGYLPPNQTARRVVLPIKTLVVGGKHKPCVQIDVDLAKFFQKVSLKEVNQIMIPSRQASLLADVFQAVFSIQRQ